MSTGCNWKQAVCLTEILHSRSCIWYCIVWIVFLYWIISTTELSVLILHIYCLFAMCHVIYNGKWLFLLSIHCITGWQGCLLRLWLRRCAEETTALGEGPASCHSFLCSQMQRQPGCSYDTGIPGNWLWLCKQGACWKSSIALDVLRITQFKALLMISWNCTGSSCF